VIGFSRFLRDFFIVLITSIYFSLWFYLLYFLYITWSPPSIWDERPPPPPSSLLLHLFLSRPPSFDLPSSDDIVDEISSREIYIFFFFLESFLLFFFDKSSDWVSFFHTFSISLLHFHISSSEGFLTFEFSFFEIIFFRFFLHFRGWLFLIGYFAGCFIEFW